MKKFMDFLVRMMQEGSLTQYVAIPEKTQVAIVTAFVIFAGIMAIVYGFHLSSRFELQYGQRGRYFFHRLLLLFLSLYIIFIYLVCPKAVSKTFLTELPTYMTIVGYVLFLFLVYGQFRMMLRLVTLNDAYAERDSSYTMLLYGWILYMVSLFISLLIKPLRPYTYWVGFGVLALQLLIDAVNTIRNRSSLLSFIANSLWLIVCVIAQMVWANLSIVLFAVGFLILSVLWGFFHSGSSNCCCGNCRSYDDGYCHYRQRYVESNDYCNKWEA